MKEKRILFITGIIMLFFMSVGLSYSYFTTAVSGNENAKDMVVEAGTLKLEYTDGPEITVKNIKPGWTITKTVTVKNTGTLDAIYNLKWKELTNTITSDELVFDLNCESSTDTCSYINLENQVVPSSPDLIMGDIIIYPGETQTLSLTFTFKELNKDQNYNQGKKFNGVLNIEETTTTNDNEYTMLAQVININNEPIANTTIELQNESKTGVTDDSGYVMIDSIKPGSHTVLVKDSSGNILDTRRVSIQQKKESDVIDSKVIYADITLPQFTTTIVLNDSSKIEEMSNLITPPDDCFTVSNGAITVYDLNNSDSCPKELIIPSEINGEKITSISYVKKSCTVSVGAFQSKNLKKVIIPDSIVTIDNYAFRENQLTSVIIPSSVTSIGSLVFENNQLMNVTILNGVTSIGSLAFENNQLTNVSIPSSVTTIEYQAFMNNKLSNVVLPEGILVIDDRVFENNQLSSITIPNSVTSIGAAAFNNNKLSDDQAFIYKRNSDGSEDKTTIVSYGGTNKNLIISDNVTTIGNSAFENNQLTSVILPSDLTTIGNSAFENNQLTSITFPDSLISIEAFAFYNNQLINVIIPKSVMTIGIQAFNNNQLKSVVIKGKNSHQDFKKYYPSSLTWGWADDVTCSKNNYHYDTNGCITWGVE